MTIADPIIQRFSNHLLELYDDPYKEPDEILLNEFEDKIRYDDIVKEDTSMLGQLAPLILQIINSNDTTAITKNYAIKFLDILLPHYSFNQIITIFSPDLLLKAFQGNDNLKRVIAKILQRTDSSKIVNAPLFLCLFKTFANPETSLSTVNEVQKAIVSVTLESDQIRQMYLNNIDIVHLLNGMKHDKIVQSRVIDLVCQVLIVVPLLPTSIYLVSEEELARSNDLLFYRFCVGTWQTLLNQVHYDDSLLFLKEKMKPQIDFCCRKFVGEKTLIDDKEIFFDYDDFGTVYFLITVSFVFPDYFRDYNSKYNIIKYASETYRQYSKSLTFLSGVNTVFMRDSEELFENLKLSNATVKLFCRLLNDRTILNERLTVDKFPPTIFDKLVFDDIFEIFGTLCDDNLLIKKLITDWSNIVKRVISFNIVNNVILVSDSLKVYLEKILKSGVSLGELEEPVREKLKKIKGVFTITVEEPLTENM